MGGPRANASEMGAGRPSASRPSPENPARDSRGGQHALGLFGCTRSRSAAPRPVAAAPQEQAPPPAPAVAPRSRYSAPALAARKEALAACERQDREFRAFLAAGRPLTAAERAALHLPAPAPSAQEDAALALPAIAATLERARSFPLRFAFRLDKLAILAALAEQEGRPVEDVLTELLSEVANFIRQRGFADAFGDALPSDFLPVTAAMSLAALAADERELYPFPDDEAGDEEHRSGGAGYVELQLACDN